MVNPWKSVFEELPANGQIVWVRVVNYYGEPVLAEFISVKKEFESIDTQIKFPTYNVARWRPQ